MDSHLLAASGVNAACSGAKMSLKRRVVDFDAWRRDRVEFSPRPITGDWNPLSTRIKPLLDGWEIIGIFEELGDNLQVIATYGVRVRTNRRHTQLS